MTTLYVTHDQEEALVLADRVAVMRAGRIEQLDVPETLYRRPRSRFVAGFVGTSNILDGKVVEIDRVGERLLVETCLGIPLWAFANTEFIAGAFIGGNAGVVLRPESIQLADTGSSPYHARLCEAVFLGNRYEVTLEVGGQLLTAHSHTLSATGDRIVGLSLEPGAIWAVP